MKQNFSGLWIWWRRTGGVALGALLLASIPFKAVHAAAQSSTPEQDVSTIIMQGLESGINFVFNNPLIGSASNADQPGQSSTRLYAALGDSVAAGVGLPNPVSVPSAETRCGRTDASYPHLVAARFQFRLTDATCSGATVGDLFTKQRDASPSLSSQLDTAFSQGNPSLITITAGANDAHWQQFLYSCYYADCTNSTTTAVANAYLSALKLKLYTLFTEIELRSHGSPPTVVYTGYYNPVSPACVGKVSSIMPAEITWFTSEVTSLNATIQGVASHYPFVRFAPVNYNGHDICASVPWVQGISDPRPFHPTAEGQQAISQAVIQVLPSRL